MDWWYYLYSKGIVKNLHSHAIHDSNKISQSVKDQISSAVESNPSLTPSDISLGKGIGFTPSAVDASSSHLGKVARVISKAKKSSACNARDWSPTTSEKHAEEVDETDFQKSGDLANRKKKYYRIGRPYLRARGMEKYLYASLHDRNCRFH